VREAKAAIEGALDAYDVLPQSEESRSQETTGGLFSEERMFQYRCSRRRSELEEYLAEPVTSHFPGFDVLKWWSMHSSIYPRLSRMAIDYLAVPSTSTPAERAFSKGADLVHVKRASLGPETIRNCMYLQSWMLQEVGCFGSAGCSALG
jgi:hypothetical protein